MTKIMDMQAALGFVVSQRSHIETEVMSVPYPEINYSTLIPVDTSAGAFASSVTHFTQDATGRAKYINGKGDDIPLVNIMRQKFEQGIDMAGIAYSFSLEEIGAAAELGRNLSTEGIAAARQAYELFVDEVAKIGDTETGSEGLFNMTGITSTAATNPFVDASTPDQILGEINTQMSAIQTETRGIEVPNTLAFPIASYTHLASRRLTDSSMTVLDYIRQSNIYTAQTQQPLMIMADHRLDDLNKMVVYKRDTSVLKMHMPMPLRFIAPQALNLEIKVPGMFRFAPVNIRRPKAVRYLTGVVS